MQLAADFDIDITWSFHQGYHGKSIYDPEGGAVKTILLHAIRNNLATVSCAAEFVKFAALLCCSPKHWYQDKLWNIVKREFYLLEKSDINRSLSDTKDVVGVANISDTYCFRSVRGSGGVRRDCVERRELTCVCDGCIMNCNGQCQFVGTSPPWVLQQFKTVPSKDRAKALVEALYRCLYYDFEFHFLSDHLVKAIQSTIASRPSAVTEFRTGATSDKLVIQWTHFRTADHHPQREGCACCSVALGRLPTDPHWKANLDSIVIAAAMAIFTAVDVSKSVCHGAVTTFIQEDKSVTQKQPKPKKPATASQRQDDVQSDVKNSDTLTWSNVVNSKFKHIWDGKWYFGKIIEVQKYHIHVEYEEDEDQHDEPYQLSKKACRAQFVNKKFILLG